MTFHALSTPASSWLNRGLEPRQVGQGGTDGSVPRLLSFTTTLESAPETLEVEHVAIGAPLDAFLSDVIVADRAFVKLKNIRKVKCVMLCVVASVCVL
jgi:hypothetical protein